MAWALLERAPQLEAARRALQGARDHSGRVLLVEASAGLGKSALLEQVAREADEAGFRVLRARGDETGQHVPHGVLQQLLRRQLRDADEHTLAAGSSAARPALAAMGLVEHEGTLAAAQVAHATWWLLDELTEQAPICLVVDDLQWSDQGSLATLAYLAGRLDGMRLLVIAARRTRAGVADEAAYAALRSAPATEAVHLAPLSRASAATLVRTLDQEADDAFVAHAYSVTGGVPFLLVEYARHQLDRDAPTGRTTTIAGASLPPRVLASVRRRLDGGSPELARVAAAAAVLDTRATIARIAASAELDAETVQALVDELERLDLVEVADDRVTFRHPLLRSATLEGALDERGWRQLARRVADALETDGAGVTTVASYLLDAPMAGDQDVARQLVAASAVALASGAPKDAASFAARAIAEPLERADERANARVLAGRAKALLGDVGSAVAELRAALEGIAEPAERADLHAECANLLFGAARHDEGVRALRDAADDLAGDSRFAQRAVLLDRRADAVEGFLGGAVDVEAILDSLPGDAAEDTYEDRVLLAMLAAMSALGHAPADRAVALARRALGDGQLLREDTADGAGFTNAVSVLLWTDTLDVLEPTVEAAIADARQRGSLLGHAAASFARGMLRARRGRLAQAAADFESVLETRGSVTTPYLPYAALTAARVYRDRGEAGRATQLAQEATKLAAQQDKRFAIVAFAARGVASTVAERHDEAMHLFRRAGESAEGTGLGAIGLADWRHEAIESAARAGRGAAVRDLAAETVELARRFGAPRPLGTALRAAAAIETERAERIALLEESVAVLEPAGIRLELARSLAALGRARDEDGAREQAIETLERAAALATDCGSTPLASRVRRWLAGLGAASGEATEHRGGVHALTPGELRVVELAAAGMTNREIAQALFVTVKAVEWHLSRAYPKLGVKGRRELPRVLDRG